MASDLGPISEIQQKLNRTQREIELLRQEIEAEDLERYPNFEDRYDHFKRSILDAEQALLAMTKLDLQESAVDLNPLIQETEAGVDVVLQAMERYDIPILTSIRNLLLELQSLMQEFEIGDDSSRRQM